MEYCGNCGAKLDGGKFCPHCGAPVSSGNSEEGKIKTEHIKRNSSNSKKVIAIGCIAVIAVAAAFFFFRNPSIMFLKEMLILYSFRKKGTQPNFKLPGDDFVLEDNPSMYFMGEVA